MRNFCPPLSLLGNTVPIRLVEEGNWNSVGLSNHFWFFFVTTLFSREQARQHLKHSVSAEPRLPMNHAFQSRTEMCVPRPLPTTLGLFLLLRLLWKAAWASGTSSPKVFRCQIFMWLIVLHIPVTTVPSPAQMLYVSAEIRTVGVGPPPHTRWLALLRLFLVLTYLLLSFWESCEFEKGKKKRLPQQLKKKK